jgi:DNA-binding transcriptional LysR family regulator
LVHYSPTLGAAPLGFEYCDGDRCLYRAMHGIITVNSSDAYQDACLAGLGLIQAPALGVQPLLAQGLLVAVLPDFAGQPMPVSLLYPHRRNVSKRVQALMAWLAKVIEPHLDHAAPSSSSR